MHQDDSFLPANAIISEWKTDFRMAQIMISFNVAEVEAILGYSFCEKSFLIEAFTHSSYYQNTLTNCYERLEVSPIEKHVLDTYVGKQLS